MQTPIEIKQETTLCEAIENFNTCMEVSDVCDTLIQALNFSQENKEAFKRAGLDKIIAYTIFEKLENFGDLTVLNENDDKEEVRTLFIEKLVYIKNHAEVKKEFTYKQIQAIITLDKNLVNAPVTKTMYERVRIKSNIIQARHLRIQREERVDVTVYPLHLAVDTTLVTLLMNNGANPNVLGYEKIGDSYGSSPEFAYYTPIETACIKYQYDKALLILSNTQHPLTEETIENALRALTKPISTKDVKTYSIEKRRELLQKLIQRASLPFVLEQLNTAMHYEKGTKEELDSTPNTPSYVVAKKDLQTKLESLNNKISLWGTRANQLLSFPVWFVLFCGSQEKDNVLYTFPLDVINLIISALSHTNYYEYETNRINPEKLRTFKNLCLSLKDQGFQNDAFFSCQFFKIKSEMSISDNIQQIKMEDYDKDPSLKSRMLINNAWELASHVYENQLLLQESPAYIALMEKAEEHSKIQTLEKIHTLMTKYTPKLEFYEPLDFQVYRNSICKDEIMLYKITKKNIDVFDPSISISYEALFLEIEKTIVKHKENHIPETGIAYNLALKHHRHFSSQNKNLVEALTSWALNTSPKNKTNLFVSAQEILFIKKDIMKCIDDLNRGKKILPEKPFNNDGPCLTDDLRIA